MAWLNLAIQCKYSCQVFKKRQGHKVWGGNETENMPVSK